MEFPNAGWEDCFLTCPQILSKARTPPHLTPTKPGNTGHTTPRVWMDTQRPREVERLNEGHTEAGMGNSEESELPGLTPSSATWELRGHGTLGCGPRICAPSWDAAAHPWPWWGTCFPGHVRSTWLGKWSVSRLVGRGCPCAPSVWLVLLWSGVRAAAPSTRTTEC